jgi:transposase-like protein
MVETPGSIGEPSRRIGGAVGGDPMYAKGGSKDVRLRAVAAVKQVELGVEALAVELSRTRRIGRWIRLRRHTGKGTFEWKQRNLQGGWTWLGARMPAEKLERMRSDTRARVLAAEALIDIRTAGRRAVQLAKWCLGNVEWWGSETVHMTWQGAGGERVTWQFGWDGRLFRRGNYLAAAGVPETHKAVVEDAIRRIGSAPVSYPVTAQVEEMVRGMEELDKRLAYTQSVLDGWCRLYYSATQDSWRFHRLTGRRNSRYLRLEEVLDGTKQIPMPDGAALVNGVALLRERRQVKRCLGVIATIGEAACRWPGGMWQLRGVQDGRQAARWTAIAGHGVVVRRYDEKKGTVADEEHRVAGEPEWGGVMERGK